jgi:hypothetical protein
MAQRLSRQPVLLAWGLLLGSLLVLACIRMVPEARVRAADLVYQDKHLDGVTITIDFLHVVRQIRGEDTDTYILRAGPTHEFVIVGLCLTNTGDRVTQWGSPELQLSGRLHDARSYERIPVLVYLNPHLTGCGWWAFRVGRAAKTRIGTLLQPDAHGHEVRWSVRIEHAARHSHYP